MVNFKFWPFIAAVIVAAIVAGVAAKIDPDDSWVYVAILLLSIAAAHAQEFNIAMQNLLQALNA